MIVCSVHCLSACSVLFSGSFTSSLSSRLLFYFHLQPQISEPCLIVCRADRCEKFISYSLTLKESSSISSLCSLFCDLAMICQDREDKMEFRLFCQSDDLRNFSFFSSFFLTLLSVSQITGLCYKRADRFGPVMGFWVDDTS